MGIDERLKIAAIEYKEVKQKLLLNKMHKGILGFGSASIPEDDTHLDEIREISHLCGERVVKNNKKISFITGGGKSTMRAWNKGAFEAGAQSCGVALDLPHERPENQLQFTNPEFAVKVKTFDARKSLMFGFGKALVVWKGGFGTLDELFGLMTLIQTKKISEMPIFIYPSDFYKNILNFEAFVKERTISKEDLDLIHYCSTKNELIDRLFKFIDNDKE